MRENRVANESLARILATKTELLNVLGNEWLEKLDEDGLPYIGTYVEEGDPICAYFDDTLNKTKIKTYTKLNVKRDASLWQL